MIFLVLQTFKIFLHHTERSVAPDVLPCDQKPETILKTYYPLKSLEQTNKAIYDSLVSNSVILGKNSYVISINIIAPDTKSQASFKYC